MTCENAMIAFEKIVTAKPNDTIEETLNKLDANNIRAVPVIDENQCLIGMSATIMDGAVLGDKVIVGAGSLAPTGKKLDSGYLYVGSPVKRVRELNEKELTFLEYSAKHYAKLKDEHSS